MAKKDPKSSVEDLLYKPLLFSTSEGSRLALIYGCDTEIQQRLSVKGKPDKSSTDTVHILDITKTIEQGFPIVEACNISNAQEFRSGLEVVDADDYMDQMIIVHTILQAEMSEIASRMQDCGQAIICLKHVASSTNKNKSKGSLTLGTETSPLASIFYSTVTGDVAGLEQKEIEKVGGVIMQIIMNNLSTDTEDAEKIKKLKAEIEYKLVDSLPDHMKAGDVHINMESILEEIRKYQGGANPEQPNNGE